MVQDPQKERVIEITRQWIEQFVIGHDLCPFAKKPFTEDRIEYQAYTGKNLVDLADLLTSEVLRLKDVEPIVIETAFIVSPNCLSDFYQYLEFYDLVVDIIASLDLQGTFQLVSFHPDYQFGDAPIGGPENFTNRSPFPMFQILREQSITIARKKWGDLEEIPERNITYLKKIGIDELSIWWESFRRSH